MTLYSTKVVKQVALSLSVLLMIFSIGFFDVVNAEKKETEMQLTREKVMDMAVEHSNAIRDLSHQIEDMTVQFSEMKQGTSMLQKLYDMLPRFSSLLTKRSVTQANAQYARYASLQQQMMSDQPRLTEVNDELATLKAVTNATQEQLDKIAALEAEALEINGRINEYQSIDSTLTSNEKSQIITMEESYELNILETQFKSMGITGHLTRDEEYEIFVHPIKVASYEFQTAISSMKVGLETAEAGVRMGAWQLYNTLIDMYGFYTLRVEGNQLSKNQMDDISAKYEQGKATKTEVAKAVNAWQTSSLEKAKMERDIDNLEMSLKQMIGLNLNQKIKLIDVPKVKGELKPLDYYIKGAVTNRNEIKNVEYSLDVIRNELDAVEDFYDTDSEIYELTQARLKEKEWELLETQQTIEKEIRTAYIEVKKKKELIDVKHSNLVQSKNESKELQRFIDMGFVTESMKEGLLVSLIQKENDKDAEIRRYNHALEAIEKASQIGPGYFAQGGMKLE